MIGATIEPKPYVRRDTTKTICVADIETDDFRLDEHGEAVAVKPFTVGFYDGSIYMDFWGDDCLDRLFDYLNTRHDEGLIIYMHYAGGFDFNFLYKYWDIGDQPRIRDGKVARAFFGGHEFRDSWRLIPAPLEENHKLAIDYTKMRADRREAHKAEILHYQKADCLSLYSLVSEYHVLYGERETIGSTSLPYLRSFHGFDTLGNADDERFRSYYFGGRCQCFETGIIDAPIDVYDVNSMYPFSMRNYMHPVGSEFDLEARIGPNTVFACIEAVNYGALASREENGSLDFTRETGVFYATIHEINAGLETGTLKILRVKHAWDSRQQTTFDRFVDHFYNARLEAKDKGDKVRSILYKYLLNSAYGKFAQDPRKYEEFMINDGERPGEDAGGAYHAENNPGGWYPKIVQGDCGLIIWARASKNRMSGFKNVATASSITGAARSILLHGLQSVERPLYCDTDAIMAIGRADLDCDESRLGGWKVEASVSRAAICGKKLYGLYGPEPPAPGKEPDKWKPEYCEGLYLIKRACKGGRLSGQELLDVARGDTIQYRNPVPHFRLDGGHDTITRTFRKTGIASNG